MLRRFLGMLNFEFIRQQYSDIKIQGIIKTITFPFVGELLIYCFLFDVIKYSNSLSYANGIYAWNKYYDGN